MQESYPLEGSTMGDPTPVHSTSPDTYVLTKSSVDNPSLLLEQVAKQRPRGCPRPPDNMLRKFRRK